MLVRNDFITTANQQVTQWNIIISEMRVGIRELLRLVNVLVERLKVEPNGPLPCDLERSPSGATECE